MNDAEISKARAIYYKLFSSFFVYSVDTSEYLQLVNMVDILLKNPIDSASEEALKSIKEKLDSTSNVKLVQEFDDLFHNPFSSTIRTTASFYDENVESGKKRVEMLGFLAKTKIRRDEENYADLEDSIAFIFTLMAELLDLVSQGHNEYKNLTHCIFSDVLNEFVDDISKEIYEHENAVIFKDVIVVLTSFIALERLYLEVSKPVQKKKEEIVSQSCSTEISDEEKERRAKNKLLKAKGPKQENESCPIDVAYDVEDEV